MVSLWCGGEPATITQSECGLVGSGGWRLDRLGGDWRCWVVQCVSAISSAQRAHESRGTAGEPRTKVSVEVSLLPVETMRLFLFICMPVLLLAQDPFPDPYQYHYLPDFAPESENHESPPGTFQQQVRVDPVVPEIPGSDLETEPTEPGPLDCREEQYPCTRLYSVHKPCKQCLNSLCFYSLRRVYVVNKEVCVRTVCAHEELLRADLCRDQFSRCGVAALSGQCASLGGSCGKSCGGC
ncbi:microfibrillar-associated protein 2 [Cynoglossus semilaevis]|uniref:Microfibril associated protein 2 n=1 Tax=Cynoglossus semilaevis TaxID=244447 RepID=A0A3P8UQT5_CYNSE|nr:microfibrillar-associated protein 2 [Cynoglossus semilaevis]